MDNITHTLVGAALAEAGPRDRFALATPTLLIAANAPDIDIAAYLLADEWAALAWRRGITHGLPALVVWPFVVAGLMLAWDRLVRRRRDPAAAPARFRPLLALAALGALTHPALDWLNTYGMRWLLPFDGAWSYGDAVFIVDPWLWLALGGAVFLARSGRPAALAGWAALAAVMSVPVLAFPIVPPAAKVAWLLGLAALAAARAVGPFPDPARSRTRLARATLAVAAAYTAIMIGAAAIAERRIAAGSAAAGIRAADVMVGPVPADPFTRGVILRSPAAYHTGTWRWSRTPGLVLSGDSILLRTGPAHVIDAALEDRRARDFLVWSRYPYAHARETRDGWSVWIGDARYAGRGLGGLEVRVGR